MKLTDTLEAARNVLRFRHMSYRTEQAYLHWIKRYAYWCRDYADGSHEDKVRGFLTALARERDVSASTQNQALNAIVFLYRHVLREEVGDFSGFHPARLPRHLPVVLSVPEVTALLAHLTGMHWLIGAQGGADRQAAGRPYPAAQLRHPPAGVRHRYSHHPATARPRARQHHPDLHPRRREGRSRLAEPAGPDRRLMRRPAVADFSSTL